MIIAVDFDGTIVEHRFPEIGREIPQAIATLKKLDSEGHRLILWSVREGKLLDDAVNYCRERGLEFFAVNANSPGEEPLPEGATGCRKVSADVYIDDRNAGGLPDWPSIYQTIRTGKSYRRILSELYEERMAAHSDRPRRSLWDKLRGR